MALVRRNPRVPPEKKEEIARRIIAGQYMMQIANALHTSTWTVCNVAKLKGLVVQKAPGHVHAENGRKGRIASPPRPSMPATDEIALQQHWAGMKANARWFNGWGG